MSGFPAIRPGMKLKPVGKQGLMSRFQANACLAVCNGLLNAKVVDTQADEFHITENNALIGVGRGTVSAGAIAMHPFKIYPTGEVDGIGRLGYNVKTGLVVVRPRYHMPGGAGLTYPFFSNSGTWGLRITPQFTDGGGPPDYTPNPLPTAQFYLDPTPEIDSGNWGAYYSFWIEITSDTNNGGAYDGTVQIKARRFSVNPSSGSYPNDLFPFPPNAFIVGTTPSKEYFPIGFVQVSPNLATSPLLSVAGFSPNGLIYQILHDCVNYDRVGDNGCAGLNYWGDWNQTGNNEGSRVWYPGDLVFYNGGGGNPLNGIYLSPIVFQSGGTPASPADTGMQFLHISNIDI